jgi:hypothetical protein
MPQLPVQVAPGSNRINPAPELKALAGQSLQVLTVEPLAVGSVEDSPGTHP